MLDADWGKKEYKDRHKDGKVWEKVVSWFGYKLHLIVDANYELPVDYAVTKASSAEQPVAHNMLTEMEETKSELLARCEYFAGDKGYDDGKLVTRLYDMMISIPKGTFRIKPVIDIRNRRQDQELTRTVPGKEDACTLRVGVMRDAYAGL